MLFFFYMKGLLIRNTRTYNLLVGGSYMILLSLLVFPCVLGLFVMIISLLFYPCILMDIFKDDIDEELKPVSWISFFVFELPFIVLCIVNVLCLWLGYAKEKSGMGQMISIICLIATIVVIVAWVRKMFNRQKELNL